MEKLLIVASFAFISISAFAQTSTTQSGNNASTINTVTTNEMVKAKKKKFSLPVVIAPATSNAAANCADNLGKGSGSANFTACEAGKKTR